MKRIIISLVGLMVILTGAAQRSSGEKATDADIAAMQAIVARQLNIISLPDKKAELMKLSGPSLTIGAINNIVKNKKNIDLNNDIAKNLKPSAGCTIEEAKTCFTTVIFQTKGNSIEKFFAPADRKGKKEAARGEIKKEIESYLNSAAPVNTQEGRIDMEVASATADGDSEPEIETDEPAEAAAPAPAEEPAEVESVAAPAAGRDGQSGSSLPLILAGVLVVILGGAAAFCYVNWQKQLRLFKDLDRRHKDLKAEWEVIRHEKNDFKKRCNELTVEIEARDRMIARLKESQQAVPPRSAGRDDSRREPSGHAPVTPPPAPQPVEEVFYAVNSMDGVFSSVSATYKKGQYLYKIVSDGGRTGEYEFINEPTSVNNAKASRSNMIESACEIMNDDERIFNRIVTTRKGVVERDGNSWRIVSKAVVRLEN